MNYIIKELDKTFNNVCVFGTKVSFAPTLKLNKVHMRENVKIWALDEDSIDKVNSIEDATNCFDMLENEVVWLENEYQTKLSELNLSSIEQQKEKLREQRKTECFEYWNRQWIIEPEPNKPHQVTQKQFDEMELWYENWLNVTDTMVTPTRPTWLSY